MSTDHSPSGRLGRHATRAATGLAAGIVYVMTSLTGSAVAGTGIVVDPSGLIATSSDVVLGAREILVRPEGAQQAYRARIVSDDSEFTLLRITDED